MATETAGLRAGTARVVITPPLGTSLAGSFNDRKAASVDDDLCAHALVLERAGTQLGLVSCDLICMPGTIAQAARERIAARVGIPGDHVLIAATHTHTGPAVAGLLGVACEEAYAAGLPAKIADSVELAARRLRPTAVAADVGKEDRVTFNRRFWMRNGAVRMNPGRGNPDIVRPAGPIDPDLAVISVTTPEGAPIGLVLNFALHYVGTDDGRAISADYFGHVRRLLQQIHGPDYLTAFFNGACGDINNVDVHDRQPLSGHRQARRVAGVVAGGALRLTSLLRPSGDAPLAAATARVPFRRKTITPEDVAVARAILAAPPDAPLPASPYAPGPFGWVVGEPLRPNVMRQYAQETLILAEMPEEMETEVQALRIGDVAIVGLPGEIFCQLGLDLKARSPFPVTLVAELANDYIGYVPTRRAQPEEGSYETWAARSSLPAAGTGETLVDTAVELLQRLR